jgi:hypothetical protein
MKRELIGSEFARCIFKFPSFKILEEGILINPISP